MFYTVEYIPHLPYTPENVNHEAVHRDFVYGIQYTQRLHGYTCKKFGPLDPRYSDSKTVNGTLDLKSPEELFLNASGAVFYQKEEGEYAGLKDLGDGKKEIIEVTFNRNRLERIRHQFTVGY